MTHPVRTRTDAETTVAAQVPGTDPAALAALPDQTVLALARVCDVLAETRPDDPRAGEAMTAMVQAVLDEAPD